MSRDEDLVIVINTLRQRIRQTEARLAKAEGALEAAQASFDATEKKLRALGYEPNKDVNNEIKKKIEKLRGTLQDIQAILDDAETSIVGTPDD